jgi:cytochrome P450
VVLLRAPPLSSESLLQHASSGNALSPGTSTLEDCLAAFSRAPQQFLLDRARTHGPVALYRLKDEIFASVSDPEIAHTVFHGSMDDFEKGPLLDVVRNIFGYGIFSADREEWTVQQKAIAPMFARHRIRPLIDTIAGLAHAQVARWQHRGDHDDDGALNALKRLAFDVVGVALLGLHDEPRRAELFDLLYQLERIPTVSLGYLGKGVPFDRLAGVVSSGEGSAVARMTRANELLYAIADERLARAEQADDVIGAVLASPAIGALPVERRRVLLRDVIASLLTAGYVSTGETMFWTLYHLARYPGAQARAREEVLAASLSLADPPPYLAAVINETMRLYPPAWYVGRTTRRPMPLGGVDIPVGTQVLCSPFVLHRSPELWPNPDTFSPERFLPGSTIVPRSFIPFGTGTRACLGKAMSLIETTSLVSATLRTFDLEVASGPPVVTLTGSYSMQPRERISLRLRPRSEPS